MCVGTEGIETDTVVRARPCVSLNLVVLYQHGAWKLFDNEGLGFSGVVRIKVFHGD